MSNKSHKQQAIDEILRTELHLSSLYTQVFESPNGKEVLEDLEAEFFHRSSLVPGDPYATHAREGAREVILFIHQKMKLGENNE